MSVLGSSIQPAAEHAITYISTFFALLHATGCKSGIISLSAIVSIRSVRGGLQPSAASARQFSCLRLEAWCPPFPRCLSVLVAVILNMADTMDEGTV